MKENRYQADIIKRLKREFPGCIVIKNDSSYIQGIPDLVVYYGPRYAFLEVKRSSHESPEPNQEYYVDLINGMSYAAFIFPENEEEVFDELQQTLGARGQARLPESQQLPLVELHRGKTRGSVRKRQSRSSWDVVA